MAFSDSIDKVVSVYFACVAAEPFTYKGKQYEPKQLRVSPQICRGFTCPANCGGCCPKFSLDYIPSEAKPSTGQFRTIEFNGHKIEIFSDTQSENAGKKCKYLNTENGRCNNYVTRPFSCDFELIRFFTTNTSTNRLTQMLFTRGWNMMRIDGERGALCSMIDANEQTKQEAIVKMQRLHEWTQHFKLQTKLPKIIDWMKDTPYNTQTPFLI